MWKAGVLLLATASLCSSALGYRVLCITPVPSRSHSALARGIINPLLKAGHEVTWVTPYAEPKPVDNLRLIVVDTQIIVDAVDPAIPENAYVNTKLIRKFINNIATMTYQNLELQQALVKEQFDAVVTEWFLSDTDAGYAAVQQVPWILLSGVVFQPFIEQLVDEIRSIPTIPFFMHNFPIPMDFWQRTVNTATFALLWANNWLDIYYASFRYDELFAPLAAARGVALRPFMDARQDVSVVLVNSHPSVAPAQSLPPNVVDIGGYHIDDASPLPKDLQELLDSSPQGVIYFSMGSVIKASSISQRTRQDLVQVLGELPYTVLWKFDEIEGLPKNVHVRPWWPQASVLAHPNIKLFITHGGLLSTLEAVHYGVPLLAIPVFGDQPSNANRAVRAGYAVRVTFSPDMGHELRIALKEMLANDSYTKTAKHLSDLFNSRPVPPAHLITHYVELAIRTKGAHHLRSKSLLYPWYQRWMLDFAAVVLLVLYVLYRAIRTVVSVFRKKNIVEKKKAKKN